MKPYILITLLFTAFSGFAQNTINDYKYVLVPEKFSFLKENDQYHLNSLTKSILEEKGFTVYFDNAELPREVAGSKCDALNVEVQQRKSMFVTNLTVLLKDCQGNILFQSKEGKSREKEYNVSYNLALRDAFTSFDEVKYVYKKSEKIQAQQPVVAATVAPLSSPNASAAAIVNEQTVSASIVGTLYAQPTANGYQLIDTTPKVILNLFKSSMQDYFIAVKGTTNGIVLKKDGEWYFDHYKNGPLVSEMLKIKF